MSIPFSDIAVRRSLKGDAACVAMRLGADAELYTWSIETRVRVEYPFRLTDSWEFYNDKQKSDEDVNAWTGQLEGLLDKACQKYMIRHKKMNNKLCYMICSGLMTKKLKVTSGYIHYIIKYFDTLKNEMGDHKSNFQRDVKTGTATIMTPKTWW